MTIATTTTKNSHRYTADVALPQLLGTKFCKYDMLKGQTETLLREAWRGGGVGYANWLVYSLTKVPLYIYSFLFIAGEI